MTTDSTAPMELSRSLFWETDFDKIDWDGKARFVIERVVSRGNWTDWKEIVRFYGLERIREEMLQVRYLDKKTLHFLSKFFNLPIADFRCYTWQQSNPGHWNF